MNIQTPNTEILEKELSQIISQSGKISVVSHDDYLVAGDMLKQIKTKQKFVKELFADAKEQAHKAHKAITAAAKTLLDPLVRAEQVCSQKVSIFLESERKRRLAEQARLQKEAEEKARVEAEERQKKEEDDRIAAAQMLESQGFKEEAEAIIQAQVAPVYVAPVAINPIQEVEKVQGVHTRTTYKAQVENLMLLVQEVAAGRQPIELLLANESVLNKMASALKNQLRIPGVRVVENSTVVTKVS